MTARTATIKIKYLAFTLFRLRAPRNHQRPPCYELSHRLGASARWRGGLAIRRWGGRIWCRRISIWRRRGHRRSGVGVGRCCVGVPRRRRILTWPVSIVGSRSLGPVQRIPVVRSATACSGSVRLGPIQRIAIPPPISHPVPIAIIRVTAIIYVVAVERRHVGIVGRIWVWITWKIGIARRSRCWSRQRGRTPRRRSATCAAIDAAVSSPDSAGSPRTRGSATPCSSATASSARLSEAHHRGARDND